MDTMGTPLKITIMTPPNKSDLRQSIRISQVNSKLLISDNRLLITQKLPLKMQELKLNSIRWYLMKAKMLLLTAFLSSHQLISIPRRRAMISMKRRNRGG